MPTATMVHRIAAKGRMLPANVTAADRSAIRAVRVNGAPLR
jgi:hypothetical protein